MGKSLRNRHDKYGVCIKFCGKSDKKSRTIANKKFRRKSKVKLLSLDETLIPKVIREVANTWDFSSDGLAHYIRFNKPSKYFGVYADLERKRLRGK